MSFAPGIVYGNLVKMMAYRGAELNMVPLEHKALAHRLNHHETALITGTRDDTDPRGQALLVFALVAPGSEIAEKAGTFIRLLKELPRPPPVGILEVVIVTEAAMKTHIDRKIAKYIEVNPTVEIETHTYDYWTCEVPIHALVPRHIIPARGEFEAHCRENYKSPADFPIIRQREPIATWLGLKVGMGVRIERISETAGTAIAYRYCLSGR